MTDARLRTNSESYTEGLRDLAAMAHVPDALRGVLRDSAGLIDKAETENGNLRIAFWNFMRKAGLHQDTALAIIREAVADQSPKGRDAERLDAQHAGAVAKPIANTSLPPNPEQTEQ